MRNPPPEAAPRSRPGCVPTLSPLAGSAWRANQSNLAAKKAEVAGDDERFRLRTLQARAFFEQAAAVTDTPKLQGIYLTSATNMTRKLDTGLAIAEYKRLLAMPSMAELASTLRDALTKAEEMQVAELRAAKKEERCGAAIPCTNA